VKESDIPGNRTIYEAAWPPPHSNRCPRSAGGPLQDARLVGCDDATAAAATDTLRAQARCRRPTPALGWELHAHIDRQKHDRHRSHGGNISDDRDGSA